jgi:hypothetical protein
VQSISEKVAVPSIILLVLGVAALIAGFVFPEVAGLKEIGGALIGASGLGGAIGFNVTDPIRSAGERVINAHDDESGQSVVALLVVILLVLLLFALLPVHSLGGIIVAVVIVLLAAAVLL